MTPLGEHGANVEQWGASNEEAPCSFLLECFCYCYSWARLGARIWRRRRAQPIDKSNPQPMAEGPGVRKGLGRQTGVASRRPLNCYRRATGSLAFGQHLTGKPTVVAGAVKKTL